MSQYLAGNEEIYFSELKEPYYWAKEFPGLQQRWGVSTESDYLKLFQGVSQKHAAAGEGSTLYLYSKSAVPAILKFQPHAKFVVMLRNPVDLAHSFHTHQLFYSQEDESSFEKAWNLQATRAEGHRIPVRCSDPALLQYRKIASLGEQMERLYQVASKDQVQPIFFEDFCKRPLQAYRTVLSFLEVAYDGRVDFPRVNAAITPRSARLTALMCHRRVLTVSRWAKQILGGRAREFAARGKQWLTGKKYERTSIAPEFRDSLVQEFSREIQLLSTLTGRDLSHWSSDSVSSIEA